MNYRLRRNDIQLLQKEVSIVQRPRQIMKEQRKREKKYCKQAFLNPKMILMSIESSNINL